MNSPREPAARSSACTSRLDEQRGKPRVGVPALGIGGWRFTVRGCGAALGLLALTVQAADWLQFRGPDGAGFAPHDHLPAQFESPTWVAPLPGRGLSSPVIVGDRVFLTAASGARQDLLHVLCFDARDGSLLWERRFWATGRTMCHEKTSVAAPSPASDGRLLLVTFSSNDVLCLDFDGNLVWLRGLTRDYPNASNSLGMASSLAVAEHTLVVMVENDSDSFTAGLDTQTGTNRWKLGRPKMASWTSPVLLRQAGRPTLVALQSGQGITAVDIATGEVTWEYTDGAATIPSSAFSGGVLYVPSHGLTALEIPASGQAPRQLWRAGTLRPGTASPVICGSRVYIVNNASVLTCGNAQNGQREWQLRLRGPVSATPVASGPYLYCLSEAGLLQVVDTAAAEGAIVSELALGETLLSTPAIAHDSLYVRSDEHLWKLSAKPPVAPHRPPERRFDIDR